MHSIHYYSSLTVLIVGVDIVCRAHNLCYTCEKQVLFYFIPFMSFVNLVIVFCLECSCQYYVRTHMQRSRPVGYLACEQRHINVLISDSISVWLNTPPLVTPGANVFFTSNSKQTRSVFTSIENYNSSSIYWKSHSSSLPFDNHSAWKGKMSYSDPVETS